MRDFRITPIEVVIVILCVGFIFILMLPAVLMSREESRSLTCQSHQVELVLELREQQDLGPLADPLNWPEILAHHLPNAMTVEHCPSDEREPPAVASYGINPQVARFTDEDVSKITFLDYNALAVSLIGENVVERWSTSVAPRHFDFVNVAFYDSHIETKAPTDIAPENSEDWFTLWLPETGKDGKLSR